MGVVRRCGRAVQAASPVRLPPAPAAAPAQLPPLTWPRLGHACRRACTHASLPCRRTPPATDNTDLHWAPTGFALTRADMVAYLQWLADTAHALGLAVGLKNAQDLLADVEDRMDW